jgi:hypothetical protein
MRYNTPIYFQRKQKGAYNASDGDYGPETTEEVKRYASVTDTGTDTLNLVYGQLAQGGIAKIPQGSLTIRLQRAYAEPFDQIRIGDGEQAKYYRSDKARLFKRVFIISEVP